MRPLRATPWPARGQRGEYKTPWPHVRGVVAVEPRAYVVAAALLFVVAAAELLRTLSRVLLFVVVYVVVVGVVVGRQREEDGSASGVVK